MGNQFLANIREADAICQVVRVFADDDVVHVDGRVDPLADIEVIETELILADMQTLEKAIPRLEKEAKKNKDLAAELTAAKQAQELLNSGKTLFSQHDSFDLSSVRSLHLMTAKPFLYVFNADESVLTDDAKKAELLAAIAPPMAFSSTPRSNPNSSNSTRKTPRNSWTPSARPNPAYALARAGFTRSGLQTYPHRRPERGPRLDHPPGDTAPRAAGVIHTDFEKASSKPKSSLRRPRHQRLHGRRQGRRQGPDGGRTTS